MPAGLLTTRSFSRTYILRVLRAVHSTLCSRVLINLRKAAAQRSDLGLDDFTTSAFRLSGTNTTRNAWIGRAHSFETEPADLL